MAAGNLGELFVSIGATTDKLESGLSDALGMVTSAGGKIASTLANVTAIAGGAALGAVTALGAAGVAAWSDMDATADTLMQRTGATGDALEAMNQSVQNLKGTSAGLGESFASIGETMATVAQRTGASGPALEQLTGALLNLQHIQGQGAVSADEFGRALNSWGVAADQGSALLDRLFVASQQTGVSTATLTGGLTQFGGALREMGLGLDESISLLSTMSAAGVDTTALMTGLRTAMAGFASEGKNVQTGLEGAISSIQNAGNSTQALQIAIDTFGNRAGPALADAIRQGKLSLDDLSASVGGFEGAIASASENALDFPDRFAMGMASVQTALVPVGQAIMNLGDAVMPVLSIGFDLARGAATSLAEALTSIQPAVQAAAQTVVAAWQDMQNVLASGGSAGQGATAFLDALGLSPGIAETIGSVVDGIISTVQSGINTLRSVVAGIASGGAGGGVSALLTALGMDPAAANQIGATINQIIATVQTAIGTLRAAIASGASAGSGASAVLQALGLDASTANTVGAVINGIIGAVQSGINTLRSIIAGFQSGGEGGGATALLTALGLDPGTASQIVAIAGTIAIGIQQALATILPIIGGLAAVVGGVLVGAFQVAGNIAKFFGDNMGPLSSIGAQVLSGLTGLAQFLTGVLGLALIALVPLVQGLGAVLGWLADTVGPALAAGLQLIAANFDTLAPIILGPIGALIQFGNNWQTILSTIIANVEVFVGQVQAGFANLTANLGVIGSAIQQAITGDVLGAFQTLQSGMAANNADYQGKLAELASSTAERTAEIQGLFQANLGALPGLVAGHMQGVTGAFGAGMANSVAVVADGAARIKAIFLNAQQMVANMPKAAGQAGERFDSQTEAAAPSGPSPAVIQATQRAAVNFQGYGAALGGLGTAAKGAGDAAKSAGSAAKTAEEKIQQAAAAINAVTETVKRVQDFIKEGLDKVIVGDPGDQLLAVIANIANFGKSLASTFAAAATGLKDDAFKAAQTLSQGISAASSGVGAVVGLLPKLWEFINSPEWGEMQGSLGMMLGVASQLVAWGRQLFDVMAAASAGVTEESAKAAQALAQGIGASAQAVSAVIGLLPKLWEFVTSPVFDEIMTNLPLLAQVAGKLILWGKVLFEMFAAAAEGVSQESAQAAQALAQGIGAAAQSITALIDLIPKLLDFAAWDQGMAVLEGPGRAALLSIVAKLSRLGRLIFDVFAQAGADIKAKTLLAAQNLAAGIKASSDGLQDVIKLTVALLDFAHWSIGFDVLNNGQTQAYIVYIAQRLAALGRLVMDAWGNAAGQLSSYTIQGAKALTDGVKQASDGLTTLISLLPQLLNFSQLATGFAILNDDAIRALIAYTAQRLASLGRVIVDQFSAAGASLSSYTLQGAANLAAGVKSAGDALTSLISLLPSLLNFSLLAQGWAILNDPATQGALVDIAFKLGALGEAIYQSFYLGAQSLLQNIPNAALELTNALKSASDAMSTLMTQGPALLAWASTATGWHILNDDNTRAQLIDIGYKLGALAQDLYDAFYLGTQSILQNIPVAAMSLLEALKSATDAMQVLMTQGPALLAFVSNEGGWRIVTDGAVQAELVDIAAKLGQLAARVYRAFYLASAALLTDIPVAASQLNEALGAAAGALKTVMETGPALLAFNATEQGWRLVTSGSLQADLVYIAQRLSDLARRVYDAFAAAAGDLTSEAVAGSKALADGIVAASAGLVSVTEAAQKLLAFNATAQGWRVITDGSLQNDIVYIGQRLSGLARRLYDVFAQAAGDLTGDAVAATRALADGIGAAVDIIGRVFEAIKLLAEPPDLPNVSDGSPLAVYLTNLVKWARQVTELADAAATGFGLLKDSGLSALNDASGSALGILQAALDAIKLLAEPVAIPPLDNTLKTYITNLVDWIQGVTETARQAAANFAAAKDSGLADLNDEVGGATGVLQAALDAIKLLKEQVDPPPLDKALKTYITRLVDWIQGVTETARTAADNFAGAKESGLAALSNEVGGATGVLQAALDGIKLLTERVDLPPLDNKLRLYITSLTNWIQGVTETARDAAANFAAVKDSGLAALSNEVGGATGTIQAALDGVKLLTERVDLPPLDNKLKLYITSLVNWIQGVTETARDAAANFSAVKDSGLAGLSNEVGGATSVIQAALDGVKLLKERVDLPPLDAGLKDYITRLADWIQGVLETARTAAQDFATVKDSGLAGLANEVGGATGVIQAALDGIKLLKERAELPPLDNKLRLYIGSLVNWIQGVTETARTAAQDFAVVKDSGLAGLANEVGGATGVIQSALDGIKLLAERADLPPLDNKLRLYIASLTNWIQGVTEVARTAAADFATVKDSGLAGLSNEVGGATGVLQAALDAIKLLGERVTIPDISPITKAGNRLRAYIVSLSEFAQSVTEVARDAAADFTIAENSGLSQLAGAIGNAATLLETGLKINDLIKKLNSFTGINFTKYGPKFDLLIDSLKELLRRFTLRAQSANFSEEAQKAVAAFSTGAGQAIDTLSKGLDFAQKIADSVNLRLPAGPQVDTLLAPIFALIDNVTAAFAAHAANVDQDHLADVVAYANGVKSFFDTIQSAIEAVQNAAGLHIESSGFNNINRLLQNLFAMFRGFSVDADAVNAVTAAISSMLGGIENLVAANGTTAGASWVDNFVAAINAGAGSIQAAIAAAVSGVGNGTGSRPGGGSRSYGAGSGQGSVTNNYLTQNYITNKNFAINVTNTDASAASATNAGLTSLVLY